MISNSRFVFTFLWLSLTSLGLAQTGGVSGFIFSENGEPLIGANIQVKGVSTGTTSDIDGSFMVQAEIGDTLLVSYVGYQAREFVVRTFDDIEILLSEDLALLDEVVVVGYGVQRKSDLTGSISTLKSEEITRITTASVEQALQGKVAGVQVTPIDGRPGSGAVIRIRGVGTLNDASPLYVVDGMLLDDISFLNNNEIESLEVLKDASATAIYGSRGANGVVIITTKRVP